MVSVYPVCDGVIVIDSSGAMPFQCFKPDMSGLGTWVFKAEPVTDFQSLIELLTFSPEMCAKFVGGCAVLFIMGYSSGFVARMLTRR